ncbi:MAG: hypothetical protein KatS3mg028_0984 [Bacteroidia bacterium]|nr:MAG: hypothetical protein KatS3mg028_0984 [Bacteroidia bacterium]
MKYKWLAFLCFGFNYFIAQVGKDGNFTTSSNIIVNQYYSVTANVNSGDNFVTVSPSPTLSPGDLVLLIQMQGASVNCYANPSNTVASLPNTNYGAITNYNNAGNYEFLQVNSVAGNTVYLACPVQKNYTASGKVQLIKVPRFSNLTVNNTIYGNYWNGNTGGVVAVEVSGTLTINSSGRISADTIGFRGGKTNLRNSSPAYGVGDMGHLDKNMGVYKGESIAGDTALYAVLFSGRFGKGAVANGGGGGNAVNAGGGGGANAGDTSAWNGKGNPDISNASWITAWNLESPGFASNTSSGGGRGGYTYSNSNKDPLVYGPNDYTNWGGDGRSNNGGLGGRPLDYASGRVFLGGGGGAGDSDNGYAGRGGNGGGIIFILNYGQIIANGIITANGRDGYNTSTPNPNINDLTGRDGAGGGGGGGAIIIRTPNPIVGTPTVTAKGGNGGNQQMKSGYIFGSPNDAYGPGGGGGGGYIGSNVSIPNTNVSGGNNGIVQYLSGSNGCLIDNNFPPNGATKGGAGIVTNTLTPPEIITVNPSSVNACVGTAVSFTATSTNTAATINWYAGYTGTIVISTGSVITMTYTTPGVYTLYAGTCPGIVRTAVTITVSPTPTITVNSSTICSGQSATLIANGASSYTWNTGATTNSVIVTPTTNTSYTVSGGSGSCIDSKTTQVIVNPSPTITVNSATICSGQSAPLVANGASSYTWNTGATTSSIIVTPTTNTSYTVSGGSGSCIDSKTTQVIVNPSPTITVNSATICSGQSATLVANGASSYTWNTGATTNSVIVTPTTNTSYTVSGGSGSCIDSKTTQVIVNPSPTITVNSATICGGQSATLVANGASSYTWNTGATTSSIIVTPTTNTSYTVSGGSGSCIDSKTTQVIVNPSPTITVNSATICSGQSATLVANGASSYTWNTGAMTYSIVVYPTVGTVYTVTGQSNGCVSTQTTDVVVQNIPALTITPSSSVICQNSCVTFSYAPSSYTNVQFDYGSGYTNNNSNCYSTMGIYFVNVTGTYSNGCISAVSSLSINVLNNPMASFSLPSQGFAGDNIQIQNNSVGAQLFNWSFGDGNSLITYSYNITHSYASSGRYCVFLTAIDTAYLCSDTITRCIDIEDDFEIEIPNVFTPNADGTNDEFKVRAKGIKEFEGYIYDRWGILLYEWKDVNMGWNGYMKNHTKAPAGTYYYLIRCVLINGDIKEYKGYLTLLD